MKIPGALRLAVLPLQMALLAACTTLVSNKDAGNAEAFTYVVGKISFAGKGFADSTDTTHTSGIEIILVNKLTGRQYTLTSRNNGMFMSIFYNIEEGVYEIAEFRLKTPEAQYGKKQSAENRIVFDIHKRRVNNLGEILWIFDAAEDESRVEFRKNYESVEGYFASRIDIPGGAWTAVRTRELRDVEYDVVVEKPPQGEEREQRAVHGIWNFGTLGLNGYRAPSRSFSALSWSLLNIYVEDEQTRLGIKISPFYYYVIESEYDEITGELIRDDSNLSLLNVDLYWNPFLRINRYGIFGPFVSVNYLTFNESQRNFFTHFVVSSGLKFMLKMNPSNIGDPAFEWLEDYSLQVVGMEAGYRYINNDHYAYFDVSLDIVTVIWFCWKLGQIMGAGEEEEEKPLAGERPFHR
jgi:hypothetical protein